MANLNRFKFTFGKKSLTLTSEHDNLFMEEIAKVATEKYQAIKEQMPSADDETIALLLAVNCLSRIRRTPSQACDLQARTEQD